MIYFMYQKPQITLNELAGKLHLSKAGVRYNLEQLKQKKLFLVKDQTRKVFRLLKKNMLMITSKIDQLSYFFFKN